MTIFGTLYHPVQVWMAFYVYGVPALVALLVVSIIGRRICR